MVSCVCCSVHGTHGIIELKYFLAKATKIFFSKKFHPVAVKRNLYVSSSILSAVVLWKVDVYINNEIIHQSPSLGSALVHVTLSELSASWEVLSSELNKLFLPLHTNYIIYIKTIIFSPF